MPIRKIEVRNVEYYLPEFETMTREELKDYQWKELKTQLDYVWKNNPFFKKRFESHGITPDDIKSPADYSKKVPLMEKKDLIADQVNHPPYGERLGVPLDKVVMTHITSGTSGLGQEVYGCTQADVNHIGSLWALHFYWGGLRPGDAFFHFLPVATMTAGLGSMVGLMQLGARYYLMAFYDTKAKLEYMKRFNPKAILTVPAYLTSLTENAKELGYNFSKDFPSIETIFIAAGAYPLSWAKDMENTWNASLSEQYGSTQMGTGFALNCEAGVFNEQGERRMMHILEPLVYAEVIDRETGESVEPGETGELVITPLAREASPLFRFATSDKVTLISHEDCPCGRPFIGIECGTVERYDDMIKMKGMNVWPAAIDSVVFDYKEVLDYRGRVFMNDKGKETVEMDIEFKTGTSKKKISESLVVIAANIQEKVGIRMNLRQALPEQIEKIQFKGKRWNDERIEGLERKTI